MSVVSAVGGGRGWSSAEAADELKAAIKFGTAVIGTLNALEARPEASGDVTGAVVVTAGTASELTAVFVLSAEEESAAGADFSSENHATPKHDTASVDVTNTHSFKTLIPPV